jgi:hypothetical protein
MYWRKPESSIRSRSVFRAEHDAGPHGIVLKLYSQALERGEMSHKRRREHLFDLLVAVDTIASNDG